MRFNTKSSHHGPQSEHKRLEYWITTAEGTRDPMVVVVELVGGNNFPHFLRELVQCYNLAQLREIMLPAAAAALLATAIRAREQRT